MAGMADKAAILARIHEQRRRIDALLDRLAMHPEDRGASARDRNSTA